MTHLTPGLPAWAGSCSLRVSPEPRPSGEANGDAGDPYTGLDRFGRVVDERWLRGGTITDEFQYGYYRDGNRLYKKILSQTGTNPPVDTGYSELYHANGAANGYDNFNQLVAFTRGTLSDTNNDKVPDTVTSATQSQSWQLDLLGNWTTLTTGTTQPVSQSRNYNQQNELTSIAGQTNPTYDANGNMTGDETGKTLVYDAWNRLSQVKSGSTVIVTYSYDPLGRRVREQRATGITDFYYSADWQVLDERQGDTRVKAQYVWSPVYVDALVLRDRDADGSTANGLEERLYVQQDANWNVTAVVGKMAVNGVPSWDVLERYIEDPYGKANVLAPDWSARVSSLFAWNYLHQGSRFDGDTGLYAFRNRDYSPTLGRWIEQDPMGFEPDANLYRFVHNAPADNTDPLGLAEFRKRYQTKIVVKTYLARIGRNIGYVSFFSQLQLSALALATDSYYSETAENDSDDGHSRFRVAVTVKFSCACGRAWRDSYDLPDVTAGKEGPFLGFVSVRGYDAVANGSVLTVSWNTVGRPNAFVQPSFWLVRPRRATQIWHRVTVQITCDQNNQAKYSLLKLVGSKFPSHVLFVDGIEKARIPQGPFSGLWTANPDDPFGNSVQ